MSTYELIWDEEARDFLKKTDKQRAERIIKNVNSIVDNPEHYLETLVEMSCHKLRIGDDRALIDWREAEKKIVVLLLCHRSEIYMYTKRTGFQRK